MLIKIALVVKLQCNFLTIPNLVILLWGEEEYMFSKNQE